MNKLISIWLGYGTAQFYSLSSIDFWQREKKERTDGEKEKLSCWWWDALSHWIIKSGAPSPWIVIAIREQNQHTAYFWAPECFQQNWMWNLVSRYDEAVLKCDIIWKGKFAFCNWLNEKENYICLFGIENRESSVHSYWQFKCSFVKDGFIYLLTDWELISYSPGWLQSYYLDKADSEFLIFLFPPCKDWYCSGVTQHLLRDLKYLYIWKFYICKL